MADDGRLNADTILGAEFEYIVQTAMQANEDRARVSNFYLVMAGSIIAGIFSFQVQEFDSATLYVLFGLLFSLLCASGFLTLLQLVRLRLAWFSAVEAMNAIKEYYIDQSADGRLADAFVWRANKLPNRFKPDSVSFYLAVQVILLGSAALGVAIFMGLRFVFGGLSQEQSFGLAFIAAGWHVVWQIAYYRYLMRQPDTTAEAQGLPASDPDSSAGLSH